MKPQPLVTVSDVRASSLWYQQVLGADSGHGGSEYEQIMVDGQMILQLHGSEEGHHHGVIGDPDKPLGNGVALWFLAPDLDAAVRRLPDNVVIVTDLHRNPNADQFEIWLNDPDGYLVVLAGGVNAG